ncbi:NACHT domain-containing protein [Streptomyces sp. HD]|uniref:NACHT domain-containing protein n=1 Tax=Streptomyces sp. HD TaxID=3020892 RepID=UPI002331083C|nr:NACHT domain-containing protein [Streptomyces sp. HD]MDC0772274.1 NACHT domain-containing protein [Streptomyces sp. HD]
MLLTLGLVALAASLALAVAVLVSHLPLGEKTLLVTTLGLFVSGVAAALAPLLTRCLGAPSDNLETRLPRSLEALAVEVGEQWKAEARLRRLQDPAPMRVRWVRGAPTLTDHRSNIPRDGTLGLPEGSGDTAELVRAFVTAPGRRVVILGPPGSGKSVLAVRFTLGLLKERAAADRLPVIFPLSSWDVQRDGLTDWLVHRLATDYEALGAGAPGRDVARELLARERILPVLDGFDELPPAVRPLALRRLNAALDTDTPLLLTSRVDEYSETVESTDVLTTATVLELLPVSLAEVCSYLASSAPPRPRADGAPDTAWAPVLERVRTDPEGTPAAALRTVLTSPLMVAMARAVSDGSRRDPNRDPMRLLDPRLGRVGAIEEHLLDAYVPAVYASASESTGTGIATEAGERARSRLAFLARHVQREGDGAIAWWRLETALPRWVRVLGPAVVAVLVAWPVLCLLEAFVPQWAYGRLWDTGGPSLFPAVKMPWIAGFSLGTALLTEHRPSADERERNRFVRRRRTITVLAGLAVACFTTWMGGDHWQSFWDRASPAGREVAWRGTALQEGYQVAFGLTTALLFGFYGLRRTQPPAVLPRLASRRGRAFAPGLALLSGTATGAVAGGVLFWFGARVDGLFKLPGLTLWGSVVPGAVVGGFTGTVAVIAGLILRTPHDPGDRPLVLTPERSLIQDRSAALVRGALLSAVTSVLLLTVALPLPRSGGNIVGIAGQLWLMTGPAALALSAWGRFLTVRVWFAVTGRLPWRLMAFLDDAHVRGVLRQVGAVYHFRHLRLQERLAPPAPDRRGPGQPPVPRPRGESSGPGHG